MRGIGLALLSFAAAARVHAAPTDPPPDQASGVETEDRVPATQRLLVVPRALLLVPRAAVWTVGQPIRGAAYAYEEYNLRGRFRDTFFNVDGTFGIYPVGTYERGFGLTGGARLVHRDLFGERERLKLRADVGGRYRQAYGMKLRSGQRFGPVVLELDTSYERRPREKFFGIGNADAAVAAEFREDAVRNVGTLDVEVTRHWHARTSGALMVRDFAGDDIATSYDTTQLVGFTDGVRNLYVEQQVVYDSRRPTSIYASEALDGTGWLLGIHAGITRGIGEDRSAYYTVGGEVQRYFDLYRGSRTLAVRALVETVIGDDGRIPFIDLPRLGGGDYLRGYAYGRFRDRTVALGTVEYAWDLGNYLAGYLFVDAGRTYRSLAELEASDLHIGYGGGVQVHTMKSFVARLQVAASHEDTFLQLAFSPALGRRERAGRF